jgi:hypothetical protein
MPRNKERPTRGLKMELTVIPVTYLDWPLAEIIRQLGNGPLLWPGGAGRAQGVRFVPYDIKKKRGRKPKAQGSSVKPLGPGSGGKTTA